jgi:Spy/CpxP family protein refolding chaperone
MKATLQKEHATLKPLMQQLHALDNQLKPYVEGTYDAAKVQSLVAAQSQALVQFKIEEARIHNELYQMLTSDQQAKLKEIEANRQARMQQHMQNAAPSQE